MLSQCIHTNKHCVLTQSANTGTDNDPQRTRPRTNIPNGKSLAVKVTPTFLNKLPPPELCHRTFQEIGYSIFSFFELWCSSVFLWASNNCAKYQRDVPPDTLTFSTLTFTSHKDALVLSKTDRFEDEEVDGEEVQHFWTNEEETSANISNNCNKCDNKPQTDTTSKDAKDMKINPSSCLDLSPLSHSLFSPTAVVRRACTGLSRGYNLNHGSLYLWFIYNTQTAMPSYQLLA